jgi:hypothetical protein
MRSLVLVLLPGCLVIDTRAPELAVDCDAASATDLSGAITVAPSEPVASVLHVEGTAFHARDLAIHRVRVGGHLAEPTGFNWEAWSVDIPYASLAGLPLDGDTAVLDVEVTDTCGVTATVARVTVEVDPTPAIAVTDLAFDVAIPGGRGYLPSATTATAQITLVANPEAAGAEVTLGASLGEILGGDYVTLSGDGFGPARATFLFASDAPGTALITASSEGVYTSASVVVAAPPALVPAALSLRPGDLASITVFSDGEIEACDAEAVAGLTATSGGVDLSVAPYAADSTGDGRPDVFVEADTFLWDAVGMRLSCWDTWGQTGAAIVIAEP